MTSLLLMVQAHLLVANPNELYEHDSEDPGETRTVKNDPVKYVNAAVFLGCVQLVNDELTVHLPMEYHSC